MQIVDNKLPSNRQVLSVFFHNMRNIGYSIDESASLITKEVEGQRTNSDVIFTLLQY